ncbi:myristoylated alanine-rich C-kinase substrate-like [Brachypodium distachyon]|uniref:myristoylated alanine-rich C-kinase substrate-like n=1 Tax=Brachypodium distachyon TaxID=15368 RepID=UPI000D0D7512|nr:myristoylated alanine-rich C-kinase substrate-like [Brachypodium distachyon]|eukprot:XP_024311809.1 myristoylated alanine-rich C-kinase substrate-like [Brachypodium distachyon]
MLRDQKDEDLAPICAKIKALRDAGLTDTDVARHFIGRRVAPLQWHSHPEWMYTGPNDRTRLQRKELTRDEIQFWVTGITGEDEAFRLLPLGAHPLHAGIPNPGAWDIPLCDEWGIVEDPSTSRNRGQPNTSPAAKKARPASGGGAKDAADAADTSTAAANGDTQVPDPSLQGTGQAAGSAIAGESIPASGGDAAEGAAHQADDGMRHVAGDAPTTPAPAEVRVINLAGEADDDAPEEAASAGALQQTTPEFAGDATATTGDETQTAPPAAEVAVAVAGTIFIGAGSPADAAAVPLAPLSVRPASMRAFLLGGAGEESSLPLLPALADESAFRGLRRSTKSGRGRGCPWGAAARGTAGTVEGAAAAAGAIAGVAAAPAPAAAAKVAVVGSLAFAAGVVTAVAPATAARVVAAEVPVDAPKVAVVAERVAAAGSLPVAAGVVTATAPATAAGAVAAAAARVLDLCTIRGAPSSSSSSSSSTGMTSRPAATRPVSSSEGESWGWSAFDSLPLSSCACFPRGAGRGERRD